MSKAILNTHEGCRNIERDAGERHSARTARRALAAHAMRKRRPALKMESTSGVRLRLTSTIHSKFVFSRNSPGGGRPSDRLLQRAPTCSLLRAGCAAEPTDEFTIGCYVRRTVHRVTTVSKINVHTKSTPATGATCARSRQRSKDRSLEGRLLLVEHHLPLSPPAGQLSYT
ncbi:unnamed protein product [Leptosia nina]|uniref:Uncharacterized protein n=1 Tax=Leptosia nina TaxID=320188 RepID=A0AAV1JLE8_9NEOP